MLKAEPLLGPDGKLIGFCWERGNEVFGLQDGVFGHTDFYMLERYPLDKVCLDGRTHHFYLLTRGLKFEVEKKLVSRSTKENLRYF